ncbi:MAG: hypothetical protein KDJ29_17730 [Hyphomicrobiales bacterium]|nr:hypothetical protein [Hyphomicrobiales bacterium]
MKNLAAAMATMLLGFGLLAAGGINEAKAASCGALNQRPCKIFERIPSCNAGLYEDFRQGRCLSRTRPAPRPVPRRVVCGGLNQRPCKIWERVPSCHGGLYEDIRRGLCLARTVPAPRPAPRRVVCGGLNQRPCKVWERVPSCNGGLYEDFRRGLCLQRVVRPPARRSCGAFNQRPCTIVERIPSCDGGLYENFRNHRCERLRPGQSAFFAGVTSLSGEIANISKICRGLLNTLPPIRTGVAVADVAIACRRGYEIGFRCAAPQVFQSIGLNSSLAGRLDAAMRSRDCSPRGNVGNAIGPFRLICALGKVVEQAAVRPAMCMAKVAANRGFTDLADGDPKTLEEMCAEAGEVAFDRAVRTLMGSPPTANESVRRFVRGLRKIRRVARKGAGIERVFQRMQQEPVCRGGLN